MISLSYINGSLMDIPMFDSFKIYESEVNDILDMVRTAYLEYKEAMDEHNLSVEFLEAADDTKKDNVSEKKTNFVDRIGNAIIELGKKTVAFITSLINKIQESMFANKSDMQKVAAFCKKNPGMADDINKAFKEGNLYVADLKSISEVEKAYDEIMRLAKQENVDPNTLKGKWINAKKKFGNLSESDIIKGIGTGVGVATAGTVLILNIGKIPEAIYNIKNFKKIAQDKSEMSENALKTSRNKLAASENEAQASAINLKMTQDREANSAKQNEVNRQISENNLKKSQREADKALIDKKNADDQRKNQKSKNKRAAEKDALDIRTKSADADTAERKNRREVIRDNQPKSVVNDKDVVNAIKGKGKGKSKYVKASYEDLSFDENGYIVESASDTLNNVIVHIHADMMKILSVLSNFNYRNLSKARAIINSAIAGFNKPYNKEEEKKAKLAAKEAKKNKDDKEEDEEE